MTGIDLFAGAGGLSLGAIQAGINVQLAVELDRHAVTTYSLNHPHTRVLNADVREFRETDLPPRRRPQVLFGGPPCQGFSISNQRTRNRRNPSNWLCLHFLRVAEGLLPEWVVFENVPGIAETEGGHFLRRIVSGLRRSGYAISTWVLNASDYGVPQRRSRLFVVGSLHGTELPAPEPAPGHAITVAHAISDLPRLPNGATKDWMPYKCEPRSAYARMMRGRRTRSPNHLVTSNSPGIVERYRYVPQGGNWQDIPQHLMRGYADPSRWHTGIYRRLVEHEPSVVIGNYRKNLLIHPRQHRGLSVREAARLQSFPDGYVFTGSIGFQQQQVANAVPPLLAKAVFGAIVANSN